MLFDYHRPATLDEALSLLDGDSSQPIGYGSDLIVWTKERVKKPPQAVIDLTGVKELKRIEEGENTLFLGACLSLGDLQRSQTVNERFPALAQAVGTMGSVQLREGASLGGNICTASPAGDSGPPLLCYDATMIVASTAKERRIPADEFYLGPQKTALTQGEILVGVELPWPPAGARGVYLKGARRAAVDLALVSVAAVAWPEPSAPSGIALRLGLGAVAPTPIRATQVEALCRDEGLDSDPLSESSKKIADATRHSVKPIDDARSSAEYRKSLVGELAARACATLARSLDRRGETR